MQVLSTTIAGELQPCTLPEQYASFVSPGADCIQSFTTPQGNTLIIQYFGDKIFRLLDLIAVCDETLLLQDNAHLIELLISLSNTLFISIDTTLSLTLHERSINILYNPSLYKTLKLRKATTTTYLSMQLPHSWFDTVADTANRHTFTTGCKDKTPTLYRKHNAVIDSSLVLAADELRWRSNADKLASALRQLQITGMRMVTDASAKPVKLEQSTVDTLYKYKKFLLTHLHENLKTDSISTFLTPASTTKEDFQTLFGLNIQRFIHEQRMLKAMRYLSQGEKMGWIANKLGYTRQGSFSEAFRTYFHTSPSEWKRKNL